MYVLNNNCCFKNHFRSINKGIDCYYVTDRYAKKFQKYIL